jgi:hypothetical protein
MLYLDVGRFIAENINRQISLDDFTGQIFDYFGALQSIDKAVLRDTMACDSLATNSTGRLPKALQVRDGRLKINFS